MGTYTVKTIDDAQELYHKYKEVKESIELCIINGDYPDKNDVIQLLLIAEEAVENVMFENDF